jgi:hypothetical protein
VVKLQRFDDAHDAHDEIATEPIAEFNVNDSTSSLFQMLYLWVFEDLGIEKSFIGLSSLGVVLWPL